MQIFLVCLVQLVRADRFIARITKGGNQVQKMYIGSLNPLDSVTQNIRQNMENRNLIFLMFFLSKIYYNKYLMASMFLKYALFATIAYLAYLFLAPTPLGVEPTSLPPFHLEKQLKDIENLDLDRLRNAHYIQFPYPFVQDVAVTRNGDIYAIAGPGPSHIYRIGAKNLSLLEQIGQTKGRALGTALNKEEDKLAFIDEVEGLKIMDLKTKQIRLVASEYQGKKFISLNSVTFSNDPNILYFTHSCDFSMTEYHFQLLYKTGNGAVFQVNLKTNEIKMLVNGLQFANGIVFSEKQNCLYVVQINKYQIVRIPLSGDKKLTPSVVIDKLIGYPDNIKLTDDGKLWVAFPSLRDAMNIFIDNQPIIRKALINSKIPQNIFLAAANTAYSGGIKVDPLSGEILQYFFGKPNRINFVTGITESNKKIYMASLKYNLIAVIDYI